MDMTGSLLFGSALLSGTALWGLVRERRRTFLQSRVIAAASSGVLVTDASVPRHPIIQANPAFRLLTGYAENEVLGQSTHLLNGAHTDRTAIEKIGLALQDSRACRVTVRHYRKSGAPFWNEVTLSPVKNRAGAVIQFIWVMNDVTQRQQTEEALKDAHDPSQILADRVTDSLLVASDTSILYLNAAGRRLLGAMDPAQLIGKPLLTIIPPGRHDTVRSRLDDFRNSADPAMNFEERLVRVDGHEIEAAVSPILWQGKPATLLSLSDLAGQKTADSAAQRLEQHLHSAESVVHLGSWEWNLIDQSHHWSDELCRIMGYDPLTVAPSHESFTSALHPEDRPQVLTALHQWLHARLPLDVACRIVQPNGAIRHIRCVGESVVRDHEGQPVRANGSVQDLTTHVMMEQLAHDRDEQFQRVIQSAPNGILLTSENGTMTLANPALERMFGYGDGELLGRSVEILLPLELRARHAEQRRTFFAAPSARPMGTNREFLGLRKDGTHIPLEYGLSPLQTSTGLQMFATLVDISTRKAIEALLGEKEALHQAVLDSLTAHVAVLDGEGTITATNTAWSNFSQQPEGTPCSRTGPGQNYLEVCRTAAEQGDWSAREALDGIEAVRSGAREAYALEYSCPAGNHVRWFTMNVVPLRGPRKGLVITHEDISSRKRTEQERGQLLAQTQHLQKMEAIGTLAGGIAHEFNNSLTAVLGFSELALKGLPKDHKVRRHLDQVIVAGRKSRDLVHQLLTFSQQGPHLKRPLSLHVLVKESLKLLRPLVPSWIQMHERILVPSTPISADASQMHQLVHHLVENALRAMQRTGGTLTVLLEEATVHQPRVGPQASLDPGAYLRLMVRDTGAGMTPDIQSRIFDPFFTTKELGEGLGMGLAVVHGIVSAHGGTVFVDSAPDVGTTVEVYLPILPAPAGAPSPAATEEPLPQGHECVLFVDDEESLARFGGELLELLGYHAVVRMSASEALEAFRMAPQRFDLLITDQTMPNRSGEALARDCRILRPDLPIIICSGSEQPLSAEAGRGQGFTEYVIKPLLLQDFARTIRRVLDRTASETPSSQQRYCELAQELVKEHDAISPSR